MYENEVRHTNKTTIGVQAEGLGKRYGDKWALRGFDLEVPAGSVLGLLGHNGAGKTTFIRMLTTLAAPTEGRAWVNGHDVVTSPSQARNCIGSAGQAATVDGLLTARANLEMIGRLYHLPVAEVRRRTAALLDRVALTADADRLVKTFSGGMRRRLDLAAALIANPAVIFLDEPTTGLDPHSRNELWALLRERVRDGATLVLTTQYLEEADRLADQIVVLDHGTIAARGTARELKAGLAGDRLVVKLARHADVALATHALAPFVDAKTPTVTTASENAQIEVAIHSHVRLIEIVRALDSAGVEAVDLHRREVTLDDVFLAMTANSNRAAANNGASV